MKPQTRWNRQLWTLSPNCFKNSGKITKQKKCTAIITTTTTTTRRWAKTQYVRGYVEQDCCLLEGFCLALRWLGLKPSTMEGIARDTYQNQKKSKKHRSVKASPLSFPIHKCQKCTSSILFLSVFFQPFSPECGTLALAKSTSSCFEPQSKQPCIPVKNGIPAYNKTK